MKLLHPTQRGNVLLATLLTCVIIGIALAGVLEHARRQSELIQRSQNWNLIMPACESGVEEALAHLNQVQTGDLAANGWTSNSTGVALSKRIGDMRYEVSISSANPPVVTSTGYLKVPLQTNEISRTVRVSTTRTRTGMFGLVAKGSINLGPGSVVDSWDSRLTGAYSAAGVRSNAFVGAVRGHIAGQGGSRATVKGDVATGPSGTITAITFTGVSSSDLNMSFPDVAPPFNPASAFAPGGGSLRITNYTTGYTTNTTSEHRAPGASETVFTNIVTQTNATPPPSPWVYTSHIVTTTNTVPPPSGVTDFNVLLGARLLRKPNLPASMGSFTTYRNETQGTTQAGKWDYDPVTHWTWTTNAYVYNTTNFTYVAEYREVSDIIIRNYDFVLGSDNYIINSISLSGHDEILVSGNARLWVTESLSMSGNARITILPGASLELYVGRSTGTGASVDIAGNGVLNQTGDSGKMAIYGLPSASSVYIRGNGEFVGCIYAPGATLHGKGGGNDVQDVQGAAVVGNVSFNGHVNFHYDEKLGDNGGITRWRIASWAEL